MTTMISHNPPDDTAGTELRATIDALISTTRAECFLSYRRDWLPRPGRDGDIERYEALGKIIRDGNKLEFQLAVNLRTEMRTIGLRVE